MEREHNELMQAAWVTARLTAYPPKNSRDFIKVEKLFVAAERAKPKQQTWQEQLAIAQQWTAALSHR